MPPRARRSWDGSNARAAGASVRSRRSRVPGNSEVPVHKAMAGSVSARPLARVSSGPMSADSPKRKPRCAVPRRRPRFWESTTSSDGRAGRSRAVSTGSDATTRRLRSCSHALAKMAGNRAMRKTTRCRRGSRSRRTICEWQSCRRRARSIWPSGRATTRSSRALRGAWRWRWPLWAAASRCSDGRRVESRRPRTPTCR